MIIKIPVKSIKPIIFDISSFAVLIFMCAIAEDELSVAFIGHQHFCQIILTYIFNQLSN